MGEVRVEELEKYRSLDMEAIIRRVEKSARQKAKEAENGARAHEALIPGEGVDVDAVFVEFDPKALLPWADVAPKQKRSADGCLIFKPWQPVQQQGM